MGFLITCTNKGCGETMEPLLDVNSNEAMCTACGKIVPGVTQFAKIQMKSLGQVKKTKEVRSAFALVCSKCNTKMSPNVINGIVVCSNCGESLEKTVSKPILHAIKQNKK